MISLARDAHILASLEGSSSVVLHQSETGKVLGIIPGQGDIRHLCISDDGRLLAIDGWSQLSHSTYLYDVGSRLLLATYTVADSSSDMSRDGRFLAICDRYGILDVYDIAAQQIAYQVTGGSYRGVNTPRFNPNGKEILVNSTGETGAWTSYYRMGQLRPIWTLPHSLSLPTFSQSGGFVAFYAPYRIQVYETAKGSLVSEGPQQGSISVAIAPDASSIYTFPTSQGGPPNTDGFRRFRLPDFAPMPNAWLSKLPQINGVEVSRDGATYYANSPSYLVTGNLPWGTMTGPLGNLPEASAWSVTYSPDGQYVITSGDRIRVWDRGTGALASPPVEHAGEILFSRSGSILATGTLPCSFFNYQNGKLTFLNSWASSDFGTTSFSISDDDQRVALSYMSSVEEGWTFSGFSIHDRHTGNVLYRIAEPANVWFVAFLASPSQVLLGEDPNVRIIDYTTGQYLHMYNSVGSVRALSPDRSIAAVETSYGTVRFLRLSDGGFVGPTLTHVGDIYTLTVTYSQDGQRILTNNARRDALPDIRLWSATTGQLLADYGDDTGSVGKSAISPSGNEFAFTTGEGIFAACKAP